METVIKVKTNYEHLLELDMWKMATAIWNFMSDSCAYCPKARERTCNDDCCAGIRTWLRAPYIQSSEVWKERNRK